MRLNREAGRPAAPVRIVHLGVGNFFRAHQAWYTEHAADAADWGIAAFTGRSPAVAEALTPQDGVYTLVTRDPEADKFEPISSLSAVHAAGDVQAWSDYFRSPELALVTTTVTEAGYRRAEDGSLNVADPQVASDIDALQSDPLALAETAPGKILAGLAARKEAGAGGVTLLPCDNLPDNGGALRQVVLDLARAVDLELLQWIEENVTFGTTMVDRITPATTDELLAEVASETGHEDASPVPTEPFSEWVISGKFANGHPDWASAGARFVDDVLPFEERKLWLLNGSHSLLAYAGQVRGHETVSQAINDELCREWVNSWWDDACANLTLPAEHLAEYRAALLERFENPRMHHALAQIGTDGSQKIPVRIVPTFKLELQKNRNALGAARAVAAWFAFLRSGKWIKDVAAETVADLVAVENEQEAAERLLAWLSPELVGSASLVVEQAHTLST